MSRGGVKTRKVVHTKPLATDWAAVQAFVLKESENGISTERLYEAISGKFGERVALKVLGPGLEGGRVAFITSRGGQMIAQTGREARRRLKK